MKNNLKIYSDVDNCPVRNILDRIGDKWSMLVLLVLDDFDVLRFNEIHKVIASISQKMLSTTLKNLEADGLIEREIFPVIPPKVEYRLTERGKSLIPHLHGLATWAKDNFTAIIQSREHFGSR
ncbi:winged helix-turn-helix transcriptional regulator [Echinicola shivajiensis]|uniref:winged helix-turn-helix transcriptional regulator n=1 Tax=Echinicola shivajiensis TaxID=1035916 RepID=UPI001BFCC09F|nr:helix-turn-helix domain-containing protein [Echinicola shivajiensis]